MKKSSKYDTSGNIEDIYEPGSRGKVLKNKLDIKSKREMEKVETDLQLKVLDQLIDRYEKGHSFSAKDICEIHQLWLGSVYPWAGKYRTVNISKNNFQFAMAKHIPNLMNDFENKILKKYTPCFFSTEKEVAEALAIVHTEFVLIHPFREGNGRMARILSTLMGLQARISSLNFISIDGKKKEVYFKAVRIGLDRNYVPMANIFKQVIEDSKK